MDLGAELLAQLFLETSDVGIDGDDGAGLGGATRGYVTGRLQRGDEALRQANV
jgi:hypothetical protein